MTPTLIYFDIRGRAEPIRLLLADLEVEYVDQQITLSDWELHRDSMPFRRIPVYREDDLVIPEAFAILSYLGRKYDLLGANEPERIRCDATVEAWKDYGNRVANAFGAMSNSEDERRVFIEETQPALLRDLECFYESRSNVELFWAGPTPTVADYVAFNYIDSFQSPKTRQQFEALGAFHDAFAGRPNVRSYLASPQRPAALFYGPQGKIFPR